MLDIGGQDTKVISLGAGGRVTDFEMNDKCAAGTGKFLEVMARALGFTLDELARGGARAETGVAISSMCTVFAESEVIGLVHRGEDRAQSHAVCTSRSPSARSRSLARVGADRPAGVRRRSGEERRHGRADPRRLRGRRARARGDADGRSPGSGAQLLSASHLDRSQRARGLFRPLAACYSKRRTVTAPCKLKRPFEYLRRDPEGAFRFQWWAMQDLNLRPLPCQGSALPLS